MTFIRCLRKFKSRSITAKEVKVKNLFFFIILVFLTSCLPEEYQEKYKKESEEYVDKVKIVSLKGSAYEHTGDVFVEGEVKNTGNRTVEKYIIMVYFLDKKGNSIYEEKYKRSYANLKPNYVKKFIISSSLIPNEWKKKKKLKAEVTFVKLEKVEEKED